MLFMAHVFIGLVLGLVLDKIYHNKNIIIFCVIGSVLPDLVNKILGHFIMASMGDGAAFYSQSLALFLLFLIIGTLTWKFFQSNSFLCVAAGIFLHKIADMGTLPDWVFPLFQNDFNRGYLQSIFLAEITSITEWIFFIAAAGITVYLIMKRSPKDTETEPDRRRELFIGIFGIALTIFILFIVLFIVFHR
jgi:hypothetical protein